MSYCNGPEVQQTAMTIDDEQDVMSQCVHWYKNLFHFVDRCNREPGRNNSSTILHHHLFSCTSFMLAQPIINLPHHTLLFRTHTSLCNMLIQHHSLSSTRENTTGNTCPTLQGSMVINNYLPVNQRHGGCFPGVDTDTIYLEHSDEF